MFAAVLTNAAGTKANGASSPTTGGFPDKPLVASANLPEVALRGQRHCRWTPLRAPRKAARLDSKCRIRVIVLAIVLNDPTHNHEKKR